MKHIVALVFTIALAGSVAAQHGHGEMKGPNGGQMQDVAGVHAELIVSGSVITLNIFNEDSKPIPTQGFSASALVVVGSDRETLALTPVAENALKGETKKPVSATALLTVTLKTADGKSGQARFKR